MSRPRKPIGLWGEGKVTVRVTEEGVGKRTARHRWGWRGFMVKQVFVVCVRGCLLRVPPAAPRLTHCI